MTGQRIRIGLLVWLGCLGLDGLFQLATARPSLLAIVVGLLAFPLAFAAVVTPRIPVRIVGPVVLFIGWTALGSMPVLLWVRDFIINARVVGALQVVLAAGLVWGLLRMRLEDRPAFHAGRSLGLAALGTFGLPVLVAVHLWLSAVMTVDALTDGYLLLTTRGLVSVERTFERDGTTVHLVGMSHIGESAAYDTLKISFSELNDAILLAEGVTDRSGTLKRGPGYERAANRIGLVQQPRAEAFGLPVKSADRDISDFSPTTREFLADALGVWAADNPAAAMSRISLRYGSDQDKAMALLETIYEDLIVARNAVVLDAVDAEAPDHTHIVVPWGAAHMPGLQAGLLEAGFVETGEPVRRALIGA